MLPGVADPDRERAGFLGGEQAGGVEQCQVQAMTQVGQRAGGRQHDGRQQIAIT
jgi:hypothetical protein